MTAFFLVAVVLLVLANGFFVAAEFALVRSRRSRLEERAEDGDAASRRALILLDDLNQYLSACQFGITLASLGIGFLGEPAIARLIEPLFGQLSHGVAVAISIAIAYILVTTLHITFGEQVPASSQYLSTAVSAQSLSFGSHWVHQAPQALPALLSA